MHYFKNIITNVIKQKKKRERKGIQMRKKDMMMSDMICYVENPKVYKKNLLEAEVS